MTRLTGITWEHRRAVDPLIATLPAFRAAHPEVDVHWEARPLSGFEFDPVDRLAERYDLIVFDHPFVGLVARTGCLLPLDDIAGDDGAYVGPSLATYRWGGAVWGLPIDAAAQVAASRPDLMGRLGAAPPRRWDEVLALGKAGRRQGLSLAIGLSGVHALMTLMTLMAGAGAPPPGEPGRTFADREQARAALARLRALVALCPAEAFDWNSIALHDAMAERDDLAYCPAVYCYATYAEADRARPLRFHDLPGVEGSAPRGSIIGGTGLGISARCKDPDAARAYARFLARADTQAAFAAHHGQPARIECWTDAAIDARFGGAFSATRRTMELAAIRPRYDGYLGFQETAGPLVEDHLRGGVGEEALLGALARLGAASAAAEAS